MQTGQRIVAMVFSGALCLATNTGLSAAESWSPVTMKPLMAVNLDARTKDVVSYFLSADGQCKLTLMIAENSPQDPSSANASRVQFAVDPGKAARLDTEEGRSLRFACEAGARAMTASMVDQAALYPAAE
jgi:hypothetical protein